ncbi:MAG: co-chaperone GroES [Alphaproteobacteria bacterium]|nr:co-chaperone GroES [Alphaproteobacteria bacterium]
MVKAVLDRVFVRLDKRNTASKGGIFLPETVEQHRNIGIVEGIGPDVSSVKVGDKVLFHVFDELPTYDADVVVLRERSLMGVIDDE